MCSNKFAYIIYLDVISHANASKIKHDDTVFLIFKLSNLHYIKTDAFWVLRIAAFKIFDASQSWLLCNDLMDIIKTSYFKIYVETMYDQLNISQNLFIQWIDKNYHYAICYSTWNYIM